MTTVHNNLNKVQHQCPVNLDESSRSLPLFPCENNNISTNNTNELRYDKITFVSRFCPVVLNYILDLASAASVEGTYILLIHSAI